jgi:hypothetical protein
MARAVVLLKLTREGAMSIKQARNLRRDQDLFHPVRLPGSRPLRHPRRV